MASLRQFSWSTAAMIGMSTAAFGQAPAAAPTAPLSPPPPPASAPPPPAAAPAAATPRALIAPTQNIPNTAAANVNGQPIMEVAVQRALKGFRPEQREQMRPEIINFLVDKTLVDQHIAQFRVALAAGEVDAKLKQVRDEIEKRGSTFEKVMHETMLTEPELKTEIEGELRWEKFVQSQATDKALRDLFEQNREIFDGTQVRARHILMNVSTDDPKAVEQAKIKLTGLKKQIEETVAQGLAKLPATTDKLARERERAKLTEETFGAVASKESACPSKSEGGDLGFFPRSGRMVEPFAQAAFRLPLQTVSDVVVTEFGCHLILVTDRRPGKQLKYEEVMEEVKMVFGDRLREALVPQLRAKAKVTINPPPK